MNTAILKPAGREITAPFGARPKMCDSFRERDAVKRTRRSGVLRLEFRLVQSARFTVGRATQCAVALDLFAMGSCPADGALVYL